MPQTTDYPGEQHGAGTDTVASKRSGVDWKRYILWLLAFALGVGLVAGVPMLLTLLLLDLTKCPLNGWARFLRDFEDIFFGLILPASGLSTLCFVAGSLITQQLWVRSITTSQELAKLAFRVGAGITVVVATILGLIYGIGERQLICVPFFPLAGFVAAQIGRGYFFAMDHPDAYLCGGRAAAIPLMIIAIFVGILGIGFALFGFAMVGCGT